MHSIWKHPVEESLNPLTATRHFLKVSSVYLYAWCLLNQALWKYALLSTPSNYHHYPLRVEAQWLSDSCHLPLASFQRVNRRHESYSDHRHRHILNCGVQSKSRGINKLTSGNKHLLTDVVSKNKSLRWVLKSPAQCLVQTTWFVAVLIIWSFTDWLTD